MLVWALGRLMAMAQELEYSRLVPRRSQGIESITGGGRKQRGKKGNIREHLLEGQRKSDNNNNCVEQLDVYKAKEVERLTLKGTGMK